MITNETAKMTYTMVEGLTQYAVGFVFDYNPDSTPQLKVYINKQSGSPLVYGVDYTISPDNLYVVISAEFEAGDRLDIIRDIPMVQISDYVIGRIDPEQIENDFDKSVERDQQLRGEIQFVGEVPIDHEERIQALETDVGNIQDLIPNQATTENQLADKEFVNSSIATSTATFRGTYSTLADLEAVTADENDYGFVESVDAVGNTIYSRYKYASGSWVFEYNLNNSSFTAAQWASINSGITAGMVEGIDNVTGRNVGDIFFTMRTDSSLSGAVECNGSQYNTSDFTGSQSIGQLLAGGKVPYVSLSDYATALSTQGSCGVFGWDGVGTTQFRVPSLNDVFIETGTAAEIGDYIPAGAPNITGESGIFGQTDFPLKTGSFKGALKRVGNSAGVSQAGNSARSTFDYGIALDASLSSDVYNDDVDTIQPETTRYRPMVQLAVAVTDEALETCTSVISQVAENTTAINGADYVVDSGEEDYGTGVYQWYRLYKSGRVEQGGWFSTSGGGGTQVTLLVEMADTTTWMPMVSIAWDSGTMNETVWSSTPTSTSTFSAYATGVTRIVWRVEGMAAQS